MKRTLGGSILWLFVFSVTGFAQVSKASFNLMPIPSSLTVGNGSFRLDQHLLVAILGNPGERLTPATNRFLARLAGRTGLFLTNPTVSTTPYHSQANFLIRVEKPGKTALGEEESYVLTISPEKILLNAPTELGAMHGLETMLQLLTSDATGYFFPSVTINDSPRFAWRGLLIDVGRRFQSVEVIRRNLDGMAMMKMNVFHWHLSDDQGFRVESKVFPKLHQLGSDGLYYTQTEVKDLIRYADLRGIRVIPEFDMPGHVTSWLVGYPDLASGVPPSGSPPVKDSTYRIERNWGVFKPLLDPTKETTYQFLEKLLKEMTMLFPDEYFHMGGDEADRRPNDGSQWRANPSIQAFMKANNLADSHALQAYFHKRVLPMLTKQGKKIMGWEEVLTPGLAKDVVVQTWRGRQSLIEAAKQGNPVVLSEGYYIDLNYSAARHYLNDPLPANIPLDGEAQKRVLGGEVTMWTEFGDPDMIDSRIWPRTAAIAERLWSPREINNVDDMYRRLELISVQLEEVGLTHLKNVDMLLRRMVQGSEITPLRTLVNVMEPVKEYARAEMAKYTSFSPLTRAVDAANPDSEQARLFSKAVDAWLESQIQQSVNQAFKKKNALEIRSSVDHLIENQLKQWQANHDQLKAIIAHAPVLQEIRTLSEDLSAIAGVGLEALTYIRTGKAAPASWLESSRTRLGEAKKPRGQAILVIVEPIAKLANWASVKK